MRANKLKKANEAVNRFLVISAALALAGLAPCNAISQQDEIANIINETMETIGATASSITVTQGDQQIYEKAFGFSDRRKKHPAKSTTSFRIGSCTKPIVAAAIHILVKQGKLSLDTKIYELLEIEPHGGRLGDERLKSITIQHLLDHQGGWDHELNFQPLFQLEKTREHLNLKPKEKVTKQHIVRFMWTEKLTDVPGEVRHYSNFGYMLLGVAIEKVTNQNLEKAINELVCETLETGDIKLSRTDKRFRPDGEVFYPNDSDLPIEIHDAASGLTASTPSLCRFMESYWLSGKQRESGSNDYFFFQTGSLPNTTSALMEQRLDGVNFAVLFNSRRNDSYDADNDILRGKLNAAIDRLLEN